MNACWLIVVTRGLSVWLPPEVYLNRDLALRESTRWRATFRVPHEPRGFSPGVRALHMKQTLFPDSWRACPIWVGIAWSERSYPRMKVDLMAADESEALAWLVRRVPAVARTDQPEQVIFDRRGVRSSVGVFRVKRVMGF